MPAADATLGNSEFTTIRRKSNLIFHFPITPTQRSRNQNQIHGYTDYTDSFLQKATKIAKMESLLFAHFAILE